MIVLEWLFLTIAPCDAAEPWQLGSQDAATPIMQGITDLHHDVFFFVILILVFVSWILGRDLWHFHYKKNPIPQRIVHGTTIEILRTIFPSIIPMFIAIPSFALLYSMDELLDINGIGVRLFTRVIKVQRNALKLNRVREASGLPVISHSHRRETLITIACQKRGVEVVRPIPRNAPSIGAYGSILVVAGEDDLELGQSCLLEVDNRVVLPAKSPIRFIVTSADVPHSWAVPSLRVKCDAVPGRLNQTSILVQREGVYYGQCSEICGTNHAYMPIVVEAVPRKDYGSRVSNQLIPQSPDKEPKALTESWGGPARRTEIDLNNLPIPDADTCRVELESRLMYSHRGSYMGEDLTSIVDKQLEIEKVVFSELLRKDYSLESLVAKRNEIRDLLFSPYGNALSEKTHALHLRQIFWEGAAQSLCFQREYCRPLRAIAKPSRIKASSSYSNSKRPTYSLSTGQSISVGVLLPKKRSQPNMGNDRQTKDLRSPCVLALCTGIAEFESACSDEWLLASPPPIRVVSVPAPSFFDEMDAERLGRRDFAKDGLSVREEGLFPFSFHCLTRFALQGREGIRAGRKGRRSSYGHKEAVTGLLKLKTELSFSLTTSEAQSSTSNTMRAGTGNRTIAVVDRGPDLDVERSSQAEAEKKAYDSVGVNMTCVKNQRKVRKLANSMFPYPSGQINGTGHGIHRQESRFDRADQMSEIFLKRKRCANLRTCFICGFDTIAIQVYLLSCLCGISKAKPRLCTEKDRR
uniref:Cytochrome c oxidase subunit 2 n=1 Tax=Solanum lycopersicum TaxID=4081 RepID=A0A3Q7HZ70_SOLLC